MKYSISDLEQLSGVHVHTIRIWERRYHALEPMRSAGNTRFYDDHHLRRLLNIVSLSQSGMKISQVCALSDLEIDQLLKLEIEETISADVQYEYYIAQMLKSGLVYNEVRFNQLITKCIQKHGMTDSYRYVLYPLLVRLGLMWRRDEICPAQEHFLSNIIRQKLFVAINEVVVKDKTSAPWLLFLPEDEDHDIGLLFAWYTLKILGERVIFLGGRVALDSLKDAMQYNQVQNLLLFMVHSRPVNNAERYLKALSDSFEHTKIHLAGNSKLISQLNLPGNITWFQSIPDLEAAIKNLAHVN